MFGNCLHERKHFRENKQSGFQFFISYALIEADGVCFAAPSLSDGQKSTVVPFKCSGNQWFDQYAVHFGLRIVDGRTVKHIIKQIRTKLRSNAYNLEILVKINSKNEKVNGKCAWCGQSDLHFHWPFQSKRCDLVRPDAIVSPFSRDHSFCCALFICCPFLVRTIFPHEIGWENTKRMRKKDAASARNGLYQTVHIYTNNNGFV